MYACNIRATVLGIIIKIPPVDDPKAISTQLVSKSTQAFLYKSVFFGVVEPKRELVFKSFKNINVHLYLSS